MLEAALKFCGAGRVIGGLDTPLNGACSGTCPELQDAATCSLCPPAAMTSMLTLLRLNSKLNTLLSLKMT